MPRGQHRAAIAGGGMRIATDAQYRVLRYWAGNTADDPARGADPRPWPDRAGLPAPAVQQRTIDVLTRYGWWAHHGTRGFIVTDAGRWAAGMPPVHRDRPCPLPACAARPGERCREIAAGVVYTDRVHDARAALTPVIRAVPARRGVGMRATRAAPFPRRTGETGRYAGGAPLAPGEVVCDVTRGDVLRALDTIHPELSWRLRSPIEPRHLGYVTAT